ncbi:ATP-binding cassette domain-containing protein, partial [Bacillus cereus]|uniref:ATP-binding cassette domain-containing protein n=1 Tax=Bacillus cereus TaxID=1396 RepID=UPI0028517988
AFGNADATYNEIIKSSEIACIHNDILHFSEGHEIAVGERGVSFSGGQKHRISIVRPLLTNAVILFLDDCLSVVYAKTEATIL